MVSSSFSCLYVDVGLVTAKVNNSLQIKNNVRAEQINVKIFFVLITVSSQVEHIFSFDILELITVFSLKAPGLDCKAFRSTFQVGR